MRRFVLDRSVDHSGISGVGRVAEGVEFTDGTVALRWLPGEFTRSTTALHDDIASVESLHGHGGDSTVSWQDDRGPLPRQRIIRRLRPATA